VKTADLINRLTVDLKPVDYRRASRALGLAFAAGSLAAVAAICLTLGLRPDLREPHALGFLLLKLVFAAGVAATAFLLLLRFARPGQARRSSNLVAALPFVGIVLLAALDLYVTPGAQWAALIAGHAWPKCLVIIPVMAAVPYALMVLALRWGAPTDLWRTGALAGLLAGGVSASAYALACGDDSLPFVACWYSSAILMCGLIGGMLGQRLLRW